MTDVFLIPDVEALVSQYLRDQSEVAALVDTRVYSIIPNTPTYPLVRVSQFDSTDLTVGWLDGAALQIDAYADWKAAASDVGRTARAVLHNIIGSHDEGVVTGVRTSGWRYEPDRSFPTAKPRFVFVTNLAVHPHPIPGS